MSNREPGGHRSAFVPDKDTRTGVEFVLNAVAVSNHRVRMLAVVRHCLSRGGETVEREVEVDGVSKGSELTLGKVNFAVTLGVLFTQCPTPFPQPHSIITGVTCPDGAGVAVVTTLVDGACLGDNIGLNVVADAGRHKHLNCLDRHLDDVTVRQ